MLPVPTSPYTPATRAFSQPLTLPERMLVPTALSQMVVVAESKALPASSELDSMLRVVVSGCSPLKTRFNSGCSHAMKSQPTLQAAAQILLAGALLCFNSTPTMDVMLLATSLIRPLYVANLPPPKFPFG